MPTIAKEKGRKGTAPPAKRPKLAKPETQPKLFDTDHPAHKPLMKAARAYAELRDSRLAILKEEVPAKGVILGLMKEHDLTEFHSDGVTIDIVPGEETVKVKVKDEDDDES